MAIPYLDIQNLTKRIGDLVLFENISFSLAEGERVGIIARNGAGKSTLLNVISGKEDYESGEIIFRNNLRIGYLEQTPQFNPEDTVLTAVSQFSESILGGTDYTDEDALFPGFLLEVRILTLDLLPVDEEHGQAAEQVDYRPIDHL